ncbi:hypothetical protein AB833_22335 [Chromatiales bacterium (ex Bugula neritina AB1)]|nr:hypothetical protein AB833_22335 [Chromatiales bacterium (ex Bugula neritina AB1)]
MAQHGEEDARHKRENKGISAFEPLQTLISQARYQMKKFALARQLAGERHTLRHLNDHLLRDIGLTRDQIKSELARGYFDIPASRYRFMGIPQGAPQNRRHNRAAPDSGA